MVTSRDAVVIAVPGLPVAVADLVVEEGGLVRQVWVLGVAGPLAAVFAGKR